MVDDLDEILKILSSRRRRSLLSVVREEEVISYDELVDALVEEGYIKEMEHLKAKLHHADLPMMADKGMLDYDERSRTISRGSREVAYEILDSVEELGQRDING